MVFSWGLLGSDTLESQRRMRSLGLNAAGRYYNDQAVPGMGNVWFGKQLFLALLGISVAEEFRRRGDKESNIKIANAIEALACFYALQTGEAESDPRVRGKRKLPRTSTPPTFAEVIRPGFYVSAPMRMATVQALPALQFVEKKSERFNTYRVAEKRGRAFLRDACSLYPKAEEKFLKWMMDGKTLSRNSDFECLLMPHRKLAPMALEILHEALADKSSEGGERRCAILQWTKKLDKQGHDDWATVPGDISQSHWNDLKAGACFFQLRADAIALLDHIEGNMQATDKLSLGEALKLKGINEKLAFLRNSAQAFLNLDEEARHAVAEAFANACTETNLLTLLTYLLERDERCLRYRYGYIVPGPAFWGKATANNYEETEDEEDTPSKLLGPLLPPGISGRVYRMYWLGREIFDQASNTRE